MHTDSVSCPNRKRGRYVGLDKIHNPALPQFVMWYIRDTSKKARVVFCRKGISGKHLGKPSYDYHADPDDKEHWIIDEDATLVVKRICDLAIDGKGPEQIAR